jgi:hypothetical protein
MIISELLAGLAAKAAGLGMAAKAGVGLGVAAASVTGAGAAGVLPAPVQDTVAAVVASTTPFTLPDADAREARTGVGASVSADATGASDGVPGVDGEAVAARVRAEAKARAEARAETETETDTDTDTGVRVGRNPGAVGLDRANQTPAAGRAPTSVPAPEAPGSQASTGLDRANQTPAAGRAPTAVPAPEAPAPSTAVGDHEPVAPVATGRALRVTLEG